MHITLTTVDTIHVSKYRVNLIIFLCLFSVTSTSLSQTCSTIRCRGLTENFPSVTVSNYSSYSIPFSSSFLQNLYPIFSSLSVSSFGFLPLCSSLTYQTILRYLSSPILTTCPYHLNCAKSIISLRFCYICSKKPDSKMQEASLLWLCTYYILFYDHMTVHHNGFVVNKTNRCAEFQFYWYYYPTCFGQPFCPSSGVLSHTSALVHFMQL